MPTLKEFGIDKLSEKERFDLVHDLWDSIEATNAGRDLSEHFPFLVSLRIDKLSKDDRIELAFAAWDSIPDDSPLLAPTPEQLKELDRRIAEHEADPSSAIPWEEVKADLLKNLHR